MRGRDGWPGGEDSGETAAGGPSKVTDYRTGQARLQLAHPTRWWLADPAAPHLCIDKPGGMAAERNRLHNPGLQRGEIKASNL